MNNNPHTILGQGEFRRAIGGELTFHPEPAHQITLTLEQTRRVHAIAQARGIEPQQVISGALDFTAALFEVSSHE